MSATITEDIPRLQRLIRDLGIHATSVHPGRCLGFDRHEIIIDWNGELESFSCVDDAEAEIRRVAG